MARFEVPPANIPVDHNVANEIFFHELELTRRRQRDSDRLGNLQDTSVPDFFPLLPDEQQGGPRNSHMRLLDVAESHLRTANEPATSGDLDRVRPNNVVSNMTGHAVNDRRTTSTGTQTNDPEPVTTTSIVRN